MISNHQTSANNVVGKQREARKFSEEKVKEFIEARAEELESGTAPKDKTEEVSIKALMGD